MVSEFKIYLDEKDIEELKSSVEISIDTMIDSKKPILSSNACVGPETYLL